MFGNMLERSPEARLAPRVEKEQFMLPLTLPKALLRVADVLLSTDAPKTKQTLPFTSEISSLPRARPDPAMLLLDIDTEKPGSPDKVTVCSTLLFDASDSILDRLRLLLDIFVPPATIKETPRGGLSPERLPLAWDISVGRKPIIDVINDEGKMTPTEPSVPFTVPLLRRGRILLTVDERSCWFMATQFAGYEKFTEDVWKVELDDALLKEADMELAISPSEPGKTTAIITTPATNMTINSTTIATIQDISLAMLTRASICLKMLKLWKTLIPKLFILFSFYTIISMEELLTLYPDGKERFVNDLEGILTKDGFEVTDKIRKGGIKAKKEVSLKSMYYSINLRANYKYIGEILKRLKTMGIPVYDVRFNDENLVWVGVVNLGAPLEYLIEPVDERKKADLTRTVKATVDSVAANDPLTRKFTDSDLFCYIDRTIDDLTGHPLSETDDRKLDRLSAFRTKLRGNETGDGGELDVILDKTFHDFSLDIVSSHDDYKKVLKLAKESRLCWGDRAKDLSKELFDDFQKYGGSVLYTVSLNDRRVGFGRDFVCFDKQGKTHLFIDIIEGVSFTSRTGYYHHVENWINDWYPGALKQSILFNIYLAKKIGVDYLTAGDVGPSRVFRALGASRKRLMLNTAEGLMLYKIGKQIYDRAGADSSNVVRSQYANSEKYYSLDMNRIR